MKEVLGTQMIQKSIERLQDSKDERRSYHHVHFELGKSPRNKRNAEDVAIELGARLNKSLKIEDAIDLDKLQGKP